MLIELPSLGSHVLILDILLRLAVLRCLARREKDLGLLFQGCHCLLGNSDAIFEEVTQSVKSLCQTADLST